MGSHWRAIVHRAAIRPCLEHADGKAAVLREDGGRVLAGVHERETVRVERHRAFETLTASTGFERGGGGGSAMGSARGPAGEHPIDALVGRLDVGVP